MRSGGICGAVVCLLVASQANAEEKPKPPVAKKRQKPALGFEMALGMAYAYDGLPGGYFGMAARLARTVGARRQLAVEIGAAVPFVLAEASDTRAEVAMFRVPTWIGVTMALGRPSETTRFALSVRGGPVIYNRSIRALTDGARIQGDDLQLAGAVGPELRFEVELSAHTALSFGLSAEVLANAPVLTYEIGPAGDAEEITVGETWLAVLGASVCLVVW